MRSYRINIDSDALEPEESFLEAVSPDSRIEKPIRSGFFIVFYFVVSIILAIFIAAGFNLGIMKGDYFAELSSQNQFISLPLSSLRGLIYSREGILLAENKETSSLWFISANPVRGKTSQADADAQAQLSEILGLATDSLSELIDKNLNKASFLVKEELTQEEKDKISSLNYQNLIIARNNIRIYPKADLFSHLIGYLSLVNENDLKNDSFYKINDKIGRAGLESFYEKELRGRRGEVRINRFSGEIQSSQPFRGNNLVLNIDFELQKNIFSELEQSLRQIGSRSGVAMAMDPRDGRILALVSLPSYDNSSFVGGLSQDEYRLLFENPKYPLLNRVISGRFAPGSTIKPLIALAALEEKVISPAKKINAPGFITLPNPYDPEIIYTFRDWKNHGWVNMREAIAHSSDIYFYTVGGGFYDVKGLGIEKLVEYFKMFKLDSALGIDLGGEVSGFVPTPEWKRENRGETWYQGDTFNVSIGQGDLLVTPLWLTDFIGALANGHTLYRPFIVARILDENDHTIKTIQPDVIQGFNFGEENLKVIREGMKLAAEVGTAKALADLPFSVGAKSGTAEVIKGQSTNSWVSVFAPFDNPQIVLTIMVESGREGSYIPHQIARKVLEQYFK